MFGLKSKAPVSQKPEVRKSILRNVEVTKSKSLGEINKCGLGTKQVKINPKPIISTDRDKHQPSTSSAASSQFHKPKLNTALKIVKKIENMKKSKEPSSKDDNICINPATESLMKEKLTQQLNFAMYQTIYKNLCPVNVNDSVLDVCEPPVKSKQIVKDMEKHERDPEPCLTDFLDPVPPFDYDFRETIRMNPIKFLKPTCSNLNDVQGVFNLADFD